MTAIHRHKTARWPRDRMRAFIVLLVLASFMVIVSFMETHATFTQSADRELRVWFFDVGQGDATFIEFPNGEQMLIDGGPDRSVLAKLGSVMSPFDRTIDAVLLTHPDADHLTGFVDVFQRYDVKQIYETGVKSSTGQAKAVDEAASREKADEKIVRAGEDYDFGKVKVRVLWPTQKGIEDAGAERNNSSIVLLLTYGDTSLLLTGDAEKEAETQFVMDTQDVDLLRVGHHGSDSSTSKTLLDVARPEYAIISVGENNRYGHPDPGVVARLKDREVDIFRTDQDGDILLRSWGGEPVLVPSPLPF